VTGAPLKVASDHRSTVKMNTPIGPSDFATTHWSVVISAKQRSPDSRQALEALCKAYWYPLYAYVRRRVPHVEEAQDLTQAFFAELLDKNYVDLATPERGRFRAFLLTAFKHFLSKQWDKANAQKRGGGRAPISLDFQSANLTIAREPAAGITAERFYDQQWAIALLSRTMDRLQNEMEAEGKGKQFTELKGFIIGDHAGSTYAEIAGRLDMSEAAARKASSRMRSKYQVLLREEIAQTVASPEEVDDEIRDLFAVLKS